MKFIFLFFIFILPLSAKAFPENVRHGYLSCTACHVSPSGGGVLNLYGKSLSAELMSTWGTTKSSGFFFSDNEDESKNPPWWRANIFLRAVQTRENSAAVEKGRFIQMQADLEAGVDFEKYALIGTVGLRAKDSSLSKELDQLFSRRHYALYRLNDNWSVRAGKFMFSFGLNGPDHVTATRRGLNWDQGTESYNFETSFLTGKSSTILSVISAEPKEKSVIKDKGLGLNQSFFINDNSKLGFSAFGGGQDLYQRSVFGPYLIWSLSKDLYLESEIFYQQKKVRASGTKLNGYATFSRLGYEAEKGLILFAQFDRSFLDTSNELSKYDSYGPGIRWLPYPHFELMAYLGKEQAFGQQASDFWWLMLNIYL